MGVDPLAQGLALLGSLLLGGLLGCVYDALRLLRRRRTALVAGSLDLLFWVLCLLLFIAYCLRFAEGDLRWDLLCGAIGGSSLYFLWLSSFVLRIYGLFARIAVEIFRICLLPLRITGAILKKIQKNSKKCFIYQRKWYKMYSSILEMDAYYCKHLHDSKKEGVNQVEAQTGIDDNKARRTGSFLLPHHHNAQSAKRHRRISGHAKRLAASSKYTSDGQ